MQQPLQNPFFFPEESPLDIKEEIRKYLRFWPWFVISLILCLIGSYFYLRYAPQIYNSTAKIKILDDKKGLELPSSSFVFNRSNINLENEMEILTSYRILEQVVEDLNLTSDFYEIRRSIKTKQIDGLPFKYEQTIDTDSIGGSQSFIIQVESENFNVLNELTEEETIIPKHDSYLADHNLPFQIRIEDSLQLIRSVRKNL